MRKKLLSIILAALMVVSLIPATVFAADYTDTQVTGEKKPLTVGAVTT